MTLYSPMKKILSTLLAALLTGVLALPALAADTRLEKIRMSNAEIVMIIGETRTLTIRYTPAAAAQPVTWRSSDTAVAEVSGGTITAIGRGECLIVAKSENGLSTSCRVTVRKEGQTVPAKSLELSPTAMSLRVDRTRTLWASPVPSDSTDTDIYWASSDNDVVTVDAEGTVTGVAPGTATITATTGGGVSAQCAVTVPGTVLKGVTGEVEVSASPGGGELLSSAAVRTAVREAAALTTKNATGTASFKNKTTVSPTVLGAAAYAATEAGRDIRLRFLTTDSDGKNQGILTLDPQLAKTRTSDLQTGVYTDSQRAVKLAERFGKFYTNTAAVFELAQEGGYGFPAEIAVRTELAAADAATLWLYTYDAAANRYTRLEVSNLRVDKNGFLRFTAASGGIIVVSRGALAKR